MIVYGILYTFGSSGEQVRLDTYLCNYINRNRIKLSSEMEVVVNEIIENRIVKANVTEDISIYFYNLKRNILSGKIDSEIYLIPSVIIKSVIDAYDAQDNPHVIEICDKVLNDCHNFYEEVVRELYYWLCLALCRTIKRNPENKDRFWHVVREISGADASFLKGFFYRNDGNYSKAESYFKEALEKYPAMDRAKRELVTALIEQKKYPEALELAKENYERSSGENTYHTYAYFLCLVRKTPLLEEDKKVLNKLILDVEEGYSNKREEISASMKIYYAIFIDKLNSTKMHDLIKETLSNFPHSKDVERAINEYKKIESGKVSLKSNWT